MSSGGSRVLIPNNIRKTILDIKEITGKHNDDDIYAMLKECNMDPNETAQRLLYLDTFHEVKKKRDRRKVNVNSRASEESRWTTGMQGRGARGGRGNYSSYNSHGGGGGRNVSARKENGVVNRIERGFKPSLTVPEKTENNTNSSNISFNGPRSISNGGFSHEDGSQSFAGDDSASNPVVLPPPSSRIPGVGAIKCEVNSSRIAVESGDSNPAGNISSTAHDANNIEVVLSTQTVLKESQIVEQNKLLEASQPPSLTASYGSMDVISIQDSQSSQQLNGPSKVVASEVATWVVEAGSQSLPELNISVLGEATSKIDINTVKLNISAHQLVIFPDHLQVPEDFKNGLTFGSLDASFEKSVKCVNGPDDKKGSTLDAEFLEGDDKATKETSPSNLSVSTIAQEGDYPDNPRTPPLVPDKSSHLEDNVSSGAAPKYDELKQDSMLPQGGPQYPFVHTAPNYGFPFIQPMLRSQVIQCEGLEPQSGNSLVSSTSGSTPTATEPAAGAGQGSITVSPPPFPVFRQPYPPNYFQYGPYFPPFYFASNALQFLGHNGFPHQPSTGNAYLSAAAAAAAGVKFLVPQGKPGMNAGNPTQFGVPSVYGSYGPSLAVTSGTSAGHEESVASELKNNSVYTTVQQGEGPLVWFPPSGRDISSLHANSFYNHLPQGQHVAFSPTQAGHGPFAGIYHPEQRMTATSTAHPLLQPSQAVAGSVETVGPTSGAYQQSQQSIHWNSNY